MISLDDLRSLPRRALWRAARGVMGTLTQVTTSDRVAAITFDDGPHGRYTPRVVDLLERYGARGTFFMVGEAARRHPEIVARVAAGGHVVAHHSWDHPSLPLISRPERIRQIRAGADALRPYGQPFFRPPFGHQDRATRLDLWRMGFRSVAWSLHAEDSKEPDPEVMASHLIDQIRPGAIILLHDALYTLLPDRLADRSAMQEALARVLAALSGWRFLTVPQLLGAGRPRWDRWFGTPPPDFMSRIRRNAENLEPA